MRRAELRRALGPRGLLVAASLLLAAGTAAARDNGPAASVEPARSPQDDQVLLLNEEGARLYAAHEYAGALARFQAAFALEQDPNLFFNIASCHRGLGDLRAAIENYRAFLESPGADSKGREPARQAIAELEAELAPKNRPPPVTAPRAPSNAPANKSWLDHPLVPWVVVGGSAIALLGGASVYALGERDHDQLSETPGLGNPNGVTGLTRVQAHDLLDAGNDKKLVGGAAMALGAALLSGYGAMLLIRELGAEPTTEDRLAIMPARRGGTLSFRGSF